jgi:hypothetical protein
MLTNTPLLLQLTSLLLLQRFYNAFCNGQDLIGDAPKTLDAAQRESAMLANVSSASKRAAAAPAPLPQAKQVRKVCHTTALHTLYAIYSSTDVGYLLVVVNMKMSLAVSQQLDNLQTAAH